MARLKARVLSTVLSVLVLSGTGWAQKVSSGDAFLQGSGTTSAVMIFAPFVSNLALDGVAGAGLSPIRFDTTMVISNPLALPTGVTTPFLTGGLDVEGTVELYCYDFDGELTFFESSMDPSVGRGLSETGTLSPGQSWIFLLQEVLGVVHGDPNRTINGHCYVVGNMDGLTGVASVIGFGVGFTQTTTMNPALGEGPTFAAGIPVVVP